MRGGASPLAIIATDTQGFIDQQHIGGFAETLLQQKRDQFAGVILPLQSGIARHTLSYGFLELGAQGRVLS
jgi:hypothetical protein